MKAVRWRLVLAIAIGFYLWYVGPIGFKGEACNPRVLATCEP